MPHCEATVHGEESDPPCAHFRSIREGQLESRDGDDPKSGLTRPNRTANLLGGLGCIEDGFCN